MKNNKSRFPKARSRVTNGAELFPDVDGRSQAARRTKEIYSSVQDLLGGPTKLTEVERILVKQFSILAMDQEVMAGKLINGEDVDMGAYGKSVKTSRRLLATLGLLDKDAEEDDEDEDDGSTELMDHLKERHGVNLPPSKVKRLRL